MAAVEPRPSPRRFRFGPFEIATDDPVLRRDGELVPLPRRAAAILLTLLERPGRVVPKAELIQRAWPGVNVDESSLKQAALALRRALGDSAEAPRYLDTVSRVGYRFVGPVEMVASTSADSAGEPARMQEEPPHARPSSASPLTGAAYPLYLQGRHFANLLTAEGYRAARQCFERAIREDPEFAPAHAGLAYLDLQAAEIILSPGEAMSGARRAAEKALRLDAGLAEAHAVLGAVRFMFDWDAVSAEESFRAACATRGWAPGAHRLYGWCLSLAGRFEEAGERFAIAADSDPTSLDRLLYETAGFWMARRWPEAMRGAEAIARLFPEHWLTHVVRGRVLEGLGEGRKALEAFRQAAACRDAADEALGDLGRRQALERDRRGAEATLAELGRLSQLRYVSPFHAAQIHAGLLQRDAFFQSLEDAFRERSWYLTWLGCASVLDPMRDDPRFAGLLQRVGLWGRGL